MITLKWLGCDGLICREIGWREVVKDYVMSKMEVSWEGMRVK